MFANHTLGFFVKVNSVNMVQRCDACRSTPHPNGCITCMSMFWRMLALRSGKDPLKCSRTRDSRVTGEDVKNAMLRTTVECFVSTNIAAVAGGMVFDGIHDPFANINDVDIFSVPELAESHVPALCGMLGSACTYEILSKKESYRGHTGALLHEIESSDVDGGVKMWQKIESWIQKNLPNGVGIHHRLKGAQSQLIPLYDSCSTPAYLQTRYISLVTTYQLYINDAKVLKVDVIAVKHPDVSQYISKVTCFREMGTLITSSADKIAHDQLCGKILKHAQSIFCDDVVRKFDFSVCAVYIYTPLKQSGSADPPETIILSHDKSCVEDAGRKSIRVTVDFFKKHNDYIISSRPARILKYLQKGCTFDDYACIT